MEIKTIAIVGATAIGRRFLYASVLAGFRTILEDNSPSTLEQGNAWIEQVLREEVSRGRIDAGAYDAALAKLLTSDSAEDASREADLIIEGVADEMEMKIELFTIFAKFAKPGAIFASTTASLSITELAEVTFSAERCIGMRFSEAPSREECLELVRGRETSRETTAICREVVRRMGKDVSVLSEGGVMSAHSGDCVLHIDDSQ
jgi:3-hydroxyacyl-CoA dehydrogenase